MSTKIYEPHVTYRARLTPAEFVALSRKGLEGVVSTKIIPPKLGGQNFGRIELTYDKPIYKKIPSSLG